VLHPFQFCGRHSIPDRAGAVYRRVFKTKYHSSLTLSPSLWVAQSRYLVSDIVRKAARTHVCIFGQKIDEEPAYSIEEYGQHCLLARIGRVLNNRALPHEATHLVRS
jgi:hypothetical protein